MIASLKNTRDIKIGIYPILILGLCLLLIGCSTAPERRHPDHQIHLSRIRTVLCITPEFGVFNASGFNLVRQEAQSRSAGEQIKTAVARVLTEKGFAVTIADEHTLNHPEIRNLRALFRAVNRSVQLHTYGPQIYPTKQAFFDYSLGPVDNLLDANGADALVMVIGKQTTSQTAPKTWLSIAMVEPQGRIIWYTLGGAQKDLQLQNAHHAKALVSEILASIRGDAS